MTDSNENAPVQAPTPSTTSAVPTVPLAAKAGLHPMVWIATLSVTAASLVGIASMTGLISPRAAETSSAPVAAQATQAAGNPSATADTTAVTPVEAAKKPVISEAVTKVEKKPIAAQRPQRERDYREESYRSQPMQVAQYGGGGYGGIPVNHGTRGDGGNDNGYTTYSSQPTQYSDAPSRNYNATPRCTSCGTVESVRAVTKEGSGSGVGAVAGGVLGGALGNGVGQGNGRALATIAGAVGGAMLGNKIEKDQKKETVYESVIRMEDGSRRTVTNESRPAWQQGDAVQVDHGAVILR